METHAQHLHKEPGKKWTHYFFEFLMLFLAVFLGFIAENQREHNVEKNRAHQFLQSMLLDVSTNIKNLDSLLHQDRAIIANHDSLMNWLLADSAAYDLTCQVNLDTSNHADIFKMEKLACHHDVLSGNDAVIFRHDMGAALALRLERLRRSMDAYKDATDVCVEMQGLIETARKI